MLKVEQHEHHCQAHIEGEMTIYTAAQLKEQLLPVLNDDKALTITLANVTEIDSAGVQLLMLVSKERSAQNRPLTLTDHSSAVVDVFELMGLANYFNDPILLTGKKGHNHES